jgi:predicted small secreted protein
MPQNPGRYMRVDVQELSTSAIKLPLSLCGDITIVSKQQLNLISESFAPTMSMSISWIAKFRLGHRYAIARPVF